MASNPRKQIANGSFDIFGNDSNSIMNNSIEDSTPNALKSGYFDRNKIMSQKDNQGSKFQNKDRPKSKQGNNPYVLDQPQKNDNGKPLQSIQAESREHIPDIETRGSKMNTRQTDKSMKQDPERLRKENLALRSTINDMQDQMKQFKTDNPNFDPVRKSAFGVMNNDEKMRIIQDYEKYIKKLKDDIRLYREAEHEVRNLKKDKMQLEEEIQRVNHIKNTLQNQLEEWQTQDQNYADQTTGLKKITQENKMYAQEIKRLRAENEFLRSENTRLGNRKEFLKETDEELENLRAQNRVLQRTCEFLREQSEGRDINERAEMEELKRKCVEMADEKNDLRDQIDELYDNLHDEKHNKQEDPRIMKLLQRVNQLEDENYGLKSLLQNKTNEEPKIVYRDAPGSNSQVPREDGYTQTSRGYNSPPQQTAPVQMKQPQNHIIIQQAAATPQQNERKTVSNPTNHKMARDLENKIQKNRELKGLLALARLEMARLGKEQGDVQKQSSFQNQDIDNLKDKISTYSKNLKSEKQATEALRKQVENLQTELNQAQNQKPLEVPRARQSNGNSETNNVHISNMERELHEKEQLLTQRLKDQEREMTKKLQDQIKKELSEKEQALENELKNKELDMEAKLLKKLEEREEKLQKEKDDAMTNIKIQQKELQRREKLLENANNDDGEYEKVKKESMARRQTELDEREADLIKKEAKLTNMQNDIDSARQTLQNANREARDLSEVKIAQQGGLTSFVIHTPKETPQVTENLDAERQRLITQEAQLNQKLIDLNAREAELNKDRQELVRKGNELQSNERKVNLKKDEVDDKESNLLRMEQLLGRPRPDNDSDSYQYNGLEGNAISDESVKSSGTKIPNNDKLGVGPGKLMSKNFGSRAIMQPSQEDKVDIFKELDNQKKMNACPKDLSFGNTKYPMDKENRIFRKDASKPKNLNMNSHPTKPNVDTEPSSPGSPDPEIAQRPQLVKVKPKKKVVVPSPYRTYNSISPARIIAPAPVQIVRHMPGYLPPSHQVLAPQKFSENPLSNPIEFVNYTPIKNGYPPKMHQSGNSRCPCCQKKANKNLQILKNPQVLRSPSQPTTKVITSRSPYILRSGGKIGHTNISPYQRMSPYKNISPYRNSEVRAYTPTKKLDMNIQQTPNRDHNTHYYPSPTKSRNLASSIPTKTIIQYSPRTQQLVGRERTVSPLVTMTPHNVSNQRYQQHPHGRNGYYTSHNGQSGPQNNHIHQYSSNNQVEPQSSQSRELYGASLHQPSGQEFMTFTNNTMNGNPYQNRSISRSPGQQSKHRKGKIRVFQVFQQWKFENNLKMC